MVERARLHLKPPEPADPLAEPVDFYMVWTKTGYPPRRAHDSLDAAQTEARRLALQHPGKKFIVLQALSKHSVTAEPPTIR
jgi:hypothetical protein